MKNYITYLTVVVLSAISCSLRAQQTLPDSLNKIAVTVSSDSAAKLYVQLARHFLSVNPDSVVPYTFKALAIAPANSTAIGDAYIQHGNYCHMTGQIDSAIFFYTKAQVHFKKINNEKGIGKVYQSFAIVKQSMKDYQGALNDNLQAIAIFEKIGFRKGLTMAYMGAANNNKFLEKNKEGAKYFYLSMNNALSLGDSALYYQTMAEYASLKFTIGEKDSAAYYFDLSIPYMERNNFRYNLITAYIIYSEIIINEKPMNDELVKKYIFGALMLSKELQVKDNLQYIYNQLGVYYVFKNKPDSVYYYMALSKAMADSLCVTQNMEILHETQTKFETEKKDLQIKNQSLELTAQEKENEAKNRLLILGSLGIIAVGVFGGIAFRNFRKSQKANFVINEQKTRVEQQKEEIEKQKMLVDVKQKEILDSIDYAKRIQSAILPPLKQFKEFLPQSFVLYKPKDIVAGDFYWLEPIGSGILFAACDCTGHGVPGALVSVICNNGLNRAVREFNLNVPGHILDRTREIVISEFEKSEEDVKDGMDIALCALNGKTLSYSGANNPLWIIRKGATEIEEIKATKQPIGVYTDPVPFVTHNVKLEEGDTFYIFSDGYGDQFGGEHGKKFKANSLKKLLLSIQSESMSKQHEILNAEFNKWRDGFEQTDDVCVIGVRV